LIARWNAFWFTPVRAGELGRLRAIFFGAMFLLYSLLVRGPAKWVEIDPVFLSETGLKLLHPRLPALLVKALWGVWLLALALSTVGLFTRAAMWLAFVLGAYLLGLPAVTTHVDGFVLIALLAFAAAPSADAFSLDALRARKKPEPSGAYRWPIQLVRVSIAFVYFSAGVTKLLRTGLAWVQSDTLRIDMALTSSFWPYDGYPARADWAMRLVRMAWPVPILAGATLLLELLFPLALFVRRARLVLVPAAIAFNGASFLLMGPWFPQLVACNVIFWLGSF
jgi:hypothetical protein